MSREKFNNWFETRYPNIQKTIDEHGYHESAVFKENMWECWQEQQKVVDELESRMAEADKLMDAAASDGTECVEIWTLYKALRGEP